MKYIYVYTYWYTSFHSDFRWTFFTPNRFEKHRWCLRQVGYNDPRSGQLTEAVRRRETISDTWLISGDIQQVMYIRQLYNTQVIYSTQLI